MKDSPLTLSSVAATLGAIVAVVSTAFALDARYIKVDEMTQFKEQVQAMFYAQEMRALQSRVLVLEDLEDSKEAGPADIRELKRLRAILKQMENKDWPAMADSFGRR